jgi:hypothetical protein
MERAIRHIQRQGEGFKISDRGSTQTVAAVLTADFAPEIPKPPTHFARAANSRSRSVDANTIPVVEHLLASTLLRTV